MIYQDKIIFHHSKKQILKVLESEKASERGVKNLKRGATVVLESTVYPGVTEEVVASSLERESKMNCGNDFYIGYSPERLRRQ